jgi:hypothetical protein
MMSAGTALARAACQPIVNGVRDLCIAADSSRPGRVIKFNFPAREKSYQPTPALGTPAVAFGVKVPSPGTFSPGTVPEACSVTTPESDEAQPVTKAMTEIKTIPITQRRITREN